MLGPDARSEKIIELFNREAIDPSGSKILAFVLLHEIEIAPMAWVGPGPDPFAASGESEQVRTTRFLASKIIPQYQPHFIPGHLSINLDTAVAGRPLKLDESLDVTHINPTLAAMLAELLPEQDLEKCSALSLSGDSPALGYTRFAVVVGGTHPQETKDSIEPVETPKRLRQSKLWMALFWIGLILLGLGLTFGLIGLLSEPGPGMQEIPWLLNLICYGPPIGLGLLLVFLATRPSE